MESKKRLRSGEEEESVPGEKRFRGEDQPEAPFGLPEELWQRGFLVKL